MTPNQALQQTAGHDSFLGLQAHRCPAAAEPVVRRKNWFGLGRRFRTRRSPELIVERRVHVNDPEVRHHVVERILQDDTVFRVLEEFRLLCEEAIAAEADVQCNGD